MRDPIPQPASEKDVRNFGDDPGKFIRNVILIVLGLFAAAILFRLEIYPALTTGNQTLSTAAATAAPVLLVENAPANRIRGYMYRSYNDTEYGPSPTIKVITHEADDFYVIFKDGHGDPWTIRWQGGEGWYSVPHEKGKIVSFTTNGSQSEWVGSMLDNGRLMAFRIHLEVIPQGVR
jgi:hypothetical protein